MQKAPRALVPYLFIVLTHTAFVMDILRIHVVTCKLPRCSVVFDPPIERGYIQLDRYKKYMRLREPKSSREGLGAAREPIKMDVNVGAITFHAD